MATNESLAPEAVNTSAEEARDFDISDPTDNEKEVWDVDVKEASEETIKWLKDHPRVSQSK